MYSACEHVPGEASRVSDPLALKLKVVVCHMMSVLGSESGSSTRAAMPLTADLCLQAQSPPS